MGRFGGSRGKKKSFKARGEPRKVPPWAAVFDLPGFRAFVEELEEVLLERELDTTREGGVVAVRLGDGSPMQLGLQTLAQQCAALDRPAWRSHIEAHLDAAFTGCQQAQHLDRRDFHGVRPLLKVRLWAASAVDTDPDLRLVANRPAQDLVAALCYDLPKAVASVLPEDAALWGLPQETLFQLALGNLASEPFTRERMEVERGAALEALHGPSFFVAAQLLRLESILGESGAPGPWRGSGDAKGEGSGDAQGEGTRAQGGPYGILCAVPTRHLVLFHRIQDAQMLVALNALMAQSWLQYNRGPGSLSPSLYWLRDGQLLLLPTEVSRRGFTFRPPPAFVEAVMTPLGSEPS